MADQIRQKSSASIGPSLIEATRRLSDAVDALPFSEPVCCVYNPLRYARAMHEAYLKRYIAGRRKVLFLGMNPGPWGMAQTGIPFGEVAAVRDWLQINAPIKKPGHEHPKRPITGMDCRRSEVSGRRLWGLFAERFESAEVFFTAGMGHAVMNYCPLVFMEDTGRNRTPDKLPPAERQPLEAACDAYLKRVIELLEPIWIVGVGKFAERKAEKLAVGMPKIRVGGILHPSPASPVANRGWAEQATRQLESQGVW